MPEIQDELGLFERAQVPSGRLTTIAAMNIRRTSILPSEAFVDNIRRMGVLEPVLLLRESSATGGAPFRIIDGQRRVEAMRIIDEMRPIPAVIYPNTTPLRVLGGMALSANLQRSPNAIQEFLAIQELMESGATVPQIASSLGIPEATIIARLRVGNLDEGLRQLLAEGRLSASLAQRLGAESLQTQMRIANEFFAENPRDGTARLTARMAYPERPQDEQIRLLPAVTHPAEHRIAAPGASARAVAGCVHAVGRSSALR